MPLGPLTICYPTVDAMLASLIATGGPFDPAALFLGVYTSNGGSGSNTTLADLVMPAGGAATRAAVVWGTPYALNDGSAVVDAHALVFADTGSDTDSIGGIYLASALTAGNLKAFADEVPPITVSASHPYTAVVRLVVDPRGRYSVSLSWNG